MEIYTYIYIYIYIISFRLVFNAWNWWCLFGSNPSHPVTVGKNHSIHIFCRGQYEQPSPNSTVTRGGGLDPQCMGLQANMKSWIDWDWQVSLEKMCWKPHLVFNARNRWCLYVRIPHNVIMITTKKVTIKSLRSSRTAFRWARHVGLTWEGLAWFGDGKSL